MAQVVEVTEAAAFHVKEMMRHNGEEGSFLRVAVNGGGCSGLTYGMGFEAEKSAGRPSVSTAWFTNSCFK